ncbi:alanine acetyltransferase [Fictibacillus phosphorivorans]|uniref:Alanine acetyltransferase n=1 Tax=Fictibacillus phosphorivorans TaxID=1221500 RepID=A0A165P7U3_9BACL|nr:GNAT family protein [Fictibacillus phosphorivorans]KZE69270.1 alanine acetyltransferase [Fictibacillus phosphorivorans]
MNQSIEANANLSSQNIYIRLLTVDDAEAMVNLQLENREFFSQFAMERNDDFYTLENQQKRLQMLVENAKQDLDYYFGIFTTGDDELIGTVNLFAVMRGSIQSAWLGYFLDEKHNGKGYTTEAVRLIVKYAFDELKLHRVEAGVMPHNIGSIRVLEKAGFEKEGLARKNVKINGKWEDHQQMAIVNPAD